MSTGSPVANVTSKRAFLLALSHREKTRALMAEADRSAADGVLDAERHAALRDFYTKHLHAAESRLNQLQDRERRKLSSLEHQLRATINNRARLVDRAVAGKVTAQKANTLNRQYEDEIGNLENAIDATQSLLNATHSAELGGLIDLPLEEYAAAPELPVSPVERWRSRRWAILFAGAFVAMLLLFLFFRQGPAGQRVEAQFTAIDTNTVGVTIVNTGAHEALLHVPWQEAALTADRAFGLQLHVKESGSEGFKLLPGSDECWKSNGLPILGVPQTLLPNIPANVTLDVNRLEQLVDRPEAVRIVLVSPGGRRISEDTFSLRPSA